MTESYSDLRVIALDGGGALVTWGQTEGTSDLMGRLVDFKGDPFGAAFVIHGDPGSGREAAPVALDGGGFLALYSWDAFYTRDLRGALIEEEVNTIASRWYEADATNRSIVLTIREEDDPPLPGGSTLVRSGPLSLKNPEGVQMADGTVAAVWTRLNAPSGETPVREIWLRRLTDDQNAIGGSVKLKTGADIQILREDVEIDALKDGGFAMTFVGRESGDRGQSAYLQLFDADGGARGAARRVSPDEGFGYDDSKFQSVTVLRDGRIVVVYNHDFYEPELGPNDRIPTEFLERETAFRIFDREGRPEGPAQRVVHDVVSHDHRETLEDVSSGRLFPEVAALPDGGFAVAFSGTSYVTWVNSSGSPWITGTESLYLARYDANGEQIGESEELTPNVNTRTRRLTPDIDVMEDGSIVIAYADLAPTEQRLRVDVTPASELYDGPLPKRGPAPEASRWDDYLEFDNRANSADGGAGNDEIVGKGGNDKLRGGAGADAVIGGSGNDEVKGGGGADWVAGDKGNDRVFGDGGADRVWGGDGKDKLSGGGGNDVLGGGRGSDTMKGGGGRDDFELRRGDGRDVIEDFRPGQDDIRIVTGAKSFGKLDIYQKGKHAYVDYGGRKDLLKLLRTDADDLDKGDFIFG